MYEKFYGLKEKPFSLIADPSFLYLSKRHELALTYLEYGLLEQAGFIVITGEVGSGKTTLIKYLMNRLDKRPIKTAMLFNTNIGPHEFLEIILREWNLKFVEKDKTALYETLNNFLIQEYSRKNKVLLIVDEAQNLPSETLEEIRMISNLNDEKQPLLHIILLGQPSLRVRLNQSILEQLRQRIAVHYHLGALDYEDTVSYVRHRLKTAGSQNIDIFMPDALSLIYEYSKGIPRVINVICDTALVYGFAEGFATINKSIIENVVEDRIKGGLFFMDSIDAPDPGLDSVGRLRYSEKGELKEHYELLNEGMHELSLLLKKINSWQQNQNNFNGNSANRHKSLSGININKQIHRENRKVNRCMYKLLKRIKNLEKRFQTFDSVRFN
jgi:general secretion pathway protein A